MKREEESPEIVYLQRYVLCVCANRNHKRNKKIITPLATHAAAAALVRRDTRRQGVFFLLKCEQKNHGLSFREEVKTHDGQIQPHSKFCVR